MRTKNLVTMLVFLLLSCSATTHAEQAPTLILEQEAKIHVLLKTDKKNRLEASGVTYADNHYYVVFDNLGTITRLCSDLSPRCATVLAKKDKVEGLEGITHHKSRFYAIIESEKRNDQPYAKLRTYDADMTLTTETWLPHQFEGLSKGFEGLVMVHRNGELFLLALCEGNDCKNSKQGRGVIKVFANSAGEWRLQASIKLPKNLKFKDYSGLDVNNGRLAVVSQSSAKMWVGQLKKSKWKIKGKGKIYAFPRNQKGKNIYCNVEGVAWITPERIVTVTDKRKKQQGKRCKAKDQSIQIFRLP